MQYLSVILATIACWGLGAVYYNLLSKPWLKAIGKTEDEIDSSDFKPYIISFVAQLICIGVIDHIFARSGINSLMVGLIAGACIGAFIIGPWVFLHNAYEGKPMKLSVINSGYATLGLAAAGAVLGLF